jgi:hypothetical protein
MTTPQTSDLPVKSPQTDGVSTIYGLTWEDFEDFETRLNRGNSRVKLSYLHGGEEDQVLCSSRIYYSVAWVRL